jgi:hypothetical protein
VRNERGAWITEVGSKYGILGKYRIVVEINNNSVFQKDIVWVSF